jgi:hypothetical protein
MSRSELLAMKNASENVLEKIETHFIFNNFLFLFLNRAVYELCGKNIVEPGRLQTTIWRMRIARWTPKATNTHSLYVILIAFPLQQCLHECASALRYTYVA